MHRAAPASRAFGRYAVGLPADPGHRRLTRRAQTTPDNGQTTTNTTTTAGLDRPCSFRNDNKQFRGLVARLPEVAVQRLNLAVFFVDKADLSVARE